MKQNRVELDLEDLEKVTGGMNRRITGYGDELEEYAKQLETLPERLKTDETEDDQEETKKKGLFI